MVELRHVVSLTTNRKLYMESPAATSDVSLSDPEIPNARLAIDVNLYTIPHPMVKFSITYLNPIYSMYTTLQFCGRGYVTLTVYPRAFLSLFCGAHSGCIY